LSGPKAKPHRISYREFRARLKDFGISEIKGRGKGSERIFARYDANGKPKASYPVKCHNEGDDVPLGTTAAALRHFGITADDFWLGVHEEAAEAQIDGDPGIAYGCLKCHEDMKYLRSIAAACEGVTIHYYSCTFHGEFKVTPDGKVHPISA
jgi:hypothetical protein